MKFAHCRDDHKNRNETIRLEITQAFLDDLQQNLTMPLIQNITKSLNLSINPFGFAGDLEIFNVSGNVTEFDVRNFSIGNDTRVLTLHDGYITFDL